MTAPDGAESVDAYIGALPEEVRGRLTELRALAHRVVPGAEESVRYGMPTFSSGGKYVAYFAAWKDHIAFYPFTDRMARELPEAAGYATSGKGTIRFPHDRLLPTDLIGKILAIRLEETAAEG